MRAGSFLGFILLTHENPKQILRLIDRLNVMFDDPPVVCHHDFSKCSLPFESIPRNVTFVKPHVKTAWGEWSLVEATLKSIKQLYAMHNPDWFMLLSGADYPIKPAGTILDDLKKSKFDAHLSAKKLVKGELKTAKDYEMYQRYRSLIFKYPSIVHFVQSIRERKWVTDNIRVKKPIYTRYFIPFSNDFICYKGSQWFAASRKASEYILKFDESNTKIRNYYKKVTCPDESYFHSILMNSEEINVSNMNWRYIDWSENKPHPKQLKMDDLAKLLESTDHFARKFNLQNNPDVLDRLDEIIGFKKKNKKTG